MDFSCPLSFRRQALRFPARSLKEHNLCVFPPSRLRPSLSLSARAPLSRRYRDHCDFPKNFDVLDFTPDIGVFQSFLSRVDARGGGDAPEDVKGGACRLLRSVFVAALYHLN